MKRTIFPIALLSFTLPVAAPSAFAEIATTRPVESAPAITLRGMVLSKSGDCFSLSVQGDKRSHWIGVGESQGGIKVTAYDRTHGVLSVNYRGKDFAIRLAAANNDGLPLKPTPRFIRTSQVDINGWENLAKLSPERRRHALEKINAMVEGFDKEIGPISAEQLNQAEKFEAENGKESEEFKKTDEYKRMIAEEQKEITRESNAEARVKADDVIDEKNIPQNAGSDKLAESQKENTPETPTPAAESDEMQDEKGDEARPDSEKTDAPKDREEEGGLSENPALMKQNITIKVNDAPGGSASVSIENHRDTGGAHGNSEFTALNFIGTNTTPASLSDLLAGDKPDGPALARLSKLSEISLLKSGFTPEKHGLEPKPENFSNILLTSYGLQVVFPPYQVGSYADGTKKVYLPAASLGGVISPKVRALWSEKAK